jgi:hypothetical protein
LLRLDSVPPLSCVQGSRNKNLNSLNQYKQANNGQFPGNISQLQPYFNPPVDDSILQRWEVAPGGTVPSLSMGDTIITQIAAVDSTYDSRYAVGNGWAPPAPRVGTRQEQGHPLS